MVVDSPRGESQAGDLSLSDLRASSACSERAHADRAGGGQKQAPPCPHGVRARREESRRAPAAGRVAARPASRARRRDGVLTSRCAA